MKKTKKVQIKVKKSPRKATPVNNKNLSLKERFLRWREDQKLKKAEDLATLPKEPVKRFFARLSPRRVARYWFSLKGLFMILKIAFVCVLLGVITVGSLFLYFKKDLAAINPENLTNQVNNTVNTYYDRNGIVLWEDKGTGDYRLVVDGDQISTYMRQATVAIEDREFYTHRGFSVRGIVRALWANVRGRAVQGGSTLTQQLIKQVYFSDEASNRDISGVPRKIKETILAVEIERMFDKEQIITLYLNQSPYGGRRNGVESGAQTYFGKSSKDLDLAESALLAAIPNNPAVYNPYNKAGHKALVARQHKVLDSMVEMNYITREQADAAKAIDILAKVLPEQSQFQDIKAPHFVLEVKKQLEAKFGMRTMRAGGFKITTTLDWRAQQIAEAATNHGAEYMKKYKITADDLAFSSVDVETSQVIAMVGSIDWNKPGYGQTNATTLLVEPGSTIKPILDYAPLFMPREGQNFGPGSILRDENIDEIYCKGTYGKCSLNNASRKFYGNVAIRESLGSSLNIAAVKALYINGIDNSLDIARRLGDWSYCANGENAGLSIAIGSGCGVRLIEHTNAYASIARGGSYKPLVYWLDVKNSNNDVIDRWEEVPAERVVDEQAAWLISDILSDAEARRILYGSGTNGVGMKIPGVWTAWKSGTTGTGSGNPKDKLGMSYSPVVVAGTWVGNHDGSGLPNDSNGRLGMVPREIIAVYMERIHKEVYGPDGRWTANQSIPRPAGIQNMTIAGKNDLWPSWFNLGNSGIEKTTMLFDSVSRKLATECTPAIFTVEVEVKRIVDPVSGFEWIQADGYDTENYDDIHVCGEDAPTIGAISATPTADGWTVSAVLGRGDHDWTTYEIWVGERMIKSGTIPTPKAQLPTVSGEVSDTDVSAGDTLSVKVVARDAGGYTASKTVNLAF
jgi:penicillin-binding protein 1A